MRRYDYIDGIIYSTDNQEEYNLDTDEDCIKLMQKLNEMSNTKVEDDKEISRLCGVMSNCHEDIRILSEKLNKEKRLKSIYHNMSQYLFEVIEEIDQVR